MDKLGDEAYMKKLYRLLFLVLFSFIVVGNSETRVLADTHFGEFKDVEVNKVWKVTFNQKVNPNTLHYIGVSLKYGKEWYINKFNYYGMDVVRNVESFTDLDKTLQKYGDYLAFESMVYFLVEEYGKDIFFETFINNKIKYGDTPTAMEKTYNKPESEMISEWKDYYNIF